MGDETRKLTHEDRILWSKVAKTVRRLDAMPMDPFLLEPEPDKPEPDARQSKKPKTPAADAAAYRPPTSQPQAATGPSPSPVRPEPRLHPIEMPVKRKISKGRVALDARLDLHGMTQSEAHNLLLDFLARAHQRGLRHVLIITGKGTSHGSDGALKRAVPQWLAKPAFRFLVSGHEPAARGHGGEGAMYIRLRRERGQAG